MKPSNILLCVLFGEGIYWLLFWRHNIRVGVVGRCYIYICDHTYGMGYRKFWWLCNMHCHQMTKAKWSNHTHIALEKRSYFWFATLYAQHYMLVSINNPREKNWYKLCAGIKWWHCCWYSITMDWWWLKDKHLMELESLNNFRIFRGSSCSGPGRGVGGWGRWWRPSTSPQPSLPSAGDQIIFQLSSCSRFSTQGPSHTLKGLKVQKVQKSQR